MRPTQLGYKRYSSFMVARPTMRQTTRRMPSFERGSGGTVLGRWRVLRHGS